MATHSEQIDLPFSQQQVFDLVADIETYPRFLPHVASARIRRRDGNTLWVDQVVRFKMLRLNFSTRAVLQPNSQINVVCTDSPMGTFNETWTFTANAAAGTRLQAHTDFEFRSRLVQAALSGSLGEMLKTTIRAFDRQARKRYGPAPDQ
jgi:coenzyme Q-binding protein COQ10